MNLSKKKLIDLKLDEAIPKQCYLEKKTKYQLMLKVVIPTISSNLKITTVDKTPKPTLYTPLSHHLTHHENQLYITYCLKDLLSDTEKANMKKIWNDVVTYNFDDEIDDSQLLASELNSTLTLF